MGKNDRGQAKTLLKKKKAMQAPSADVGDGPPYSAIVEPGSDSDVKMLLNEMWHSLRSIVSKIDTLTARLDKMKDKLEKHDDQLDRGEQRVSDVEDDSLTHNEQLFTYYEWRGTNEIHNKFQNIQICCSSAAFISFNMLNGNQPTHFVHHP
ncbi:hypothetical protein NDU88_002900 [Pleurodeles waltl]|uniref:Uncharacterized protein n=1 Tax=Pleurodeles waltl TaxID=8319 RepID=A0AAV7TM05_PLEWA|nr:hypothetical protein NDU88_002900 [Pleurodeles waltl]